MQFLALNDSSTLHHLVSCQSVPQPFKMANSRQAIIKVEPSVNPPVRTLNESGEAPDSRGELGLSTLSCKRAAHVPPNTAGGPGLRDMGRVVQQQLNPTPYLRMGSGANIQQTDDSTVDDILSDFRRASWMLLGNECSRVLCTVSCMAVRLVVTSTSLRQRESVVQYRCCISRVSSVGIL
jgi:hypothetical protein